MASANNNMYGVPPKYLTDLSHVEAAFISPARSYGYVFFHHASSRFLRVPACSSLGLLLIGPEASHLATIQRWGNT